jgi:hypothetical protein
MQFMREHLLPGAIAWTLIATMPFCPLARAGQPDSQLASQSANHVSMSTGIWPVEYTGNFPSYFQSEIEQTVVNALERSGKSPVMLRSDPCVQLECARRIASKAGIDVFIMSRVLHENRDYQVVFVAYAVDDGRVLAKTSADCIICGQQELLDAIPAKVIELEAQLAQVLAAQTLPARLAVDGTPNEARLTFDGDAIESRPVRLDLVPGDHQLEISAQGHTTQVHRWNAINGVEQQIEYRLMPRQPAPGLEIAGWVAVSLGVAATATGITLVAMDSSFHRPTCGPDRIDSFGECPFIYSTATAGYVGLGVGVAAIAAGTGLLIHHRRQKPRPSSAHVGVTPHGLSLRF